MKGDHIYDCQCPTCREFWGDDPETELETLRFKVRAYESALKDITELELLDPKSATVAYHVAMFALQTQSTEDHT